MDGYAPPGTHRHVLLDQPKLHVERR
jgi:hypothetical protein